MPKEQVSAEEVVQALIQRISAGQFVPGDRLPPVRKLAEELGANRNTVNKAYLVLVSMGLAESQTSGRKGYTVKKRDLASGNHTAELVQFYAHQMVDLAWQGMAAGISVHDLNEQWKKALGTVFKLSEVTLIFYECNDFDTNEMGRRLADILGMPVVYKNLNHFYAQPLDVVREYDLLITTYHHLAEVTQALAALELTKEKVVGIDTRLTEDTMLRIARFPHSRIGVICTNQNTAHMIKHVLFGYHPEWDIRAAISCEAAEVRDIAANCDHLLVTHTCSKEVTDLTGKVPDVVVNFKIDEQSVDFLFQRINEVRRQKMGASFTS